MGIAVFFVCLAVAFRRLRAWKARRLAAYTDDGGELLCQMTPYECVRAGVSARVMGQVVSPMALDPPPPGTATLHEFSVVAHADNAWGCGAGLD